MRQFKIRRTITTRRLRGCSSLGSGTLGAKSWESSLGGDVLAWLRVEELLTLERAEVVRLAAMLTLAADRVLGHQTAPLRHCQGEATSLLPAGTALRGEDTTLLGDGILAGGSALLGGRLPTLRLLCSAFA